MSMSRHFLGLLDDLGIPHQPVHLPPVYTVEEAKRLRCELPGLRQEPLSL